MCDTLVFIITINYIFVKQYIRKGGTTMKRIFATVGFSFVFSLLLLNHFISEFVIPYIIVTNAFSAVSLLIKSLRKHKEIPCIFLSVALSAVIFSVVTELSYKP